MPNTQNTYQYIIAGGGMAGLSLAFYLNQSDKLRNKSILIIDREEKNVNDHTWCFWETGKSPFEEIVFRKWQGVWFHGTENFSQFLNLQEYTYKMVRGIDFYEYIISKLKQNSNITFLQANIEAVGGSGIHKAGVVCGDTDNGSESVVSVSTDDQCVNIKTDKGDFMATEFVFDSSFRSNYNNPKQHNMLQHFKGWVIDTTKPVFKIDEPTLFDFRIEQKDELRFVYVLPYSETKALIEFTIFSDNLITQEEYEFYLKKYIEETIKVGDYQIKTDEYQISETEFGVIPMSDEKHEISPMNKVIRIGTSGGYVKASTGYTFQRSQRFLQNLVGSLEVSNSITNGIKINKWKGVLDTVLLNVMLNKRAPQDGIFTDLFKNNKSSRILKFLDEDTSFFEDLLVINSVPKTPFIKAAWQVLTKKMAS